MIVWGLLLNRYIAWQKFVIKRRLSARKQMKQVRHQIYASMGHPKAAMKSSVLK